MNERKLHEIATVLWEYCQKIFTVLYIVIVICLFSLFIIAVIHVVHAKTFRIVKAITKVYVGNIFKNIF